VWEKRKYFSFFFYLFLPVVFLYPTRPARLSKIVFERKAKGKKISRLSVVVKGKKKNEGEKGVRAALSIKRHFQREVRRLQTRRWKPWRS
jgi:hypothetical protein